MANLLTFAALVALGFVFKNIEWTFGADAAAWVALGWIAATVLWQCAHKLRYGHWFDPPDLNGDMTGAPKRDAKRAAFDERPGVGGRAPPPAIKL